MTDAEATHKISGLVLGIHHRNGGGLAAVDFSLPLLDPVLRLDSLDLAEIMAAIERECGVSPFERGAPRTWAEVVRLVGGRAS